MSEVSQPNLIETIEKALEAATIGPWSIVKFIDGKTHEIWQSIDNTGIARLITHDEAEANAQLIANAPEWLRALLEENKQLNNVQRQYDGAISAMESEAKEMESQLQQTREELERSRGSHMFQYGLSLELEIKRLKEELEQDAREHRAFLQLSEMNSIERERIIESLRTELSAKDKALEWYGDKDQWEKHYGNIAGIDFDKGEKARSILSQYRGESK